VDEDFEISVEVKGRDPKITCEIIGIYSAPNEDMGAIERLQPEPVIQGVLESIV
jgi:hypothetical protein